MAISAQRICDRCDALARHSEQPDGLTRVFLSPEQRAVTDLVRGWMGEAGMDTRIDAIGNVIGRYEGEHPGLPCLMLGSHLDTVRDAGKYDGMLGVVTAIECVADLSARAVRLPFAIEVIGFADEEGVRFSATLLGSRAVAGTFDPAWLDKSDQDGTTMRSALKASGLDPARVGDAARRRDDVLAYVELHIEQGPVLEAEGLPVGVVTAISGGNRFNVEVAGMAGHAGTVPMPLRRDALAAAAECALAIERIARGDAGSRRHRGQDRSAARRDQRHSRQGALHARCPRAGRRIARTRRRRDARRVRGDRRPPRRDDRADPDLGSAHGGRARRRCSASSPKRSMPRACASTICLRVRDTTAWRSSISRRSACCSCAARAASATIRPKPSRVADVEVGARVLSRFIAQFSPPHK